MNDYKTSEGPATNGFLACCNALTPVIHAVREDPTIQIDFCRMMTDPMPCVSVTVWDLDSYRALVDRLREICGNSDYKDLVTPLDQENGTCSYIHDIRFGPVRISCTEDDSGIEKKFIW